tara:strand:+ start:292 stop:531 length:240 start_codon:yes stop_codon:yes gene_type:complete
MCGMSENNEKNLEDELEIHKKHLHETIKNWKQVKTQLGLAEPNSPDNDLIDNIIEDFTKLHEHTHKMQARFYKERKENN